MLRKGDRIKHPKKPEWGVGEVLEGQRNDKVRIYFGRLAGVKRLNIQYVTLERVSGKEADDPMLRNIALPGEDSKTRIKSTRSLDEAIESFLTEFPGGFRGPVYQEQERDYKEAAVHAMASLLGDGELARLIAARDFKEVALRARRLVSKTNLIFPNEAMKLNDGLKNGNHQHRFATALNGLLTENEEERVRFERFADCLESLGAANWTIASYFQFLRWPDRRLFIKPTITQELARILNKNIAYRPALNWTTYTAVQHMASDLMEAINDALAPRDMIDVQGFMYCVVKG